VRGARCIRRWLRRGAATCPLCNWDVLTLFDSGGALRPAGAQDAARRGVRPVDAVEACAPEAVILDLDDEEVQIVHLPGPPPPPLNPLPPLRHGTSPRAPASSPEPAPPSSAADRRICVRGAHQPGQQEDERRRLVSSLASVERDEAQNLRLTPPPPIARSEAQAAHPATQPQPADADEHE
jgi:hypothetical protein